MKKYTPAQETDDELVKRIKTLVVGNTLRQVQRDECPFASIATLARIAKGVTPVRKRLRDNFGLSTMVVVPACPNCGKGHTRKCYPRNKTLRLVQATQDVAVMITYVKTLRKLEDGSRKNYYTVYCLIIVLPL